MTLSAKVVLSAELQHAVILTTFFLWEVTLTLAKVQGRGQITLPREIRRMAGINPGDTVTIKALGPGRVEVHVVPRLTLQELLERYRIEGPVDIPADRQKWQETAAKEALDADGL